MKNLIYLSIMLILLVNAGKTEEDLICKPRMLQFYGLTGLLNPVEYARLVPDLHDNYCPSIEKTCCSLVDFETTHKLWENSSKKIKAYLTNIFRVIQKAVALQSSLQEIYDSVKHLDTEHCNEVEATYFNSTIRTDEVYFFIQNALEAFAFMQKGFYCMICDAKMQQSLFRETESLTHIAFIDPGFCKDLIFFFREFILYKVSFLDSFIKNANSLFNCYTGTEQFTNNPEYRIQYMTILDCVENNKYCNSICQEFKFGQTSELFLGKLSDYQDFLDNIEQVIKIHNARDKLKKNKEAKIIQLPDLNVLDKKIDDNFFKVEKTGNPHGEVLTKNFNISDLDIVVREGGINLFGIAVHSRYFLADDSTRKKVRENYGLNVRSEEDSKSKSSQKDESHVSDVVAQYFSVNEKEEVVLDDIEDKALTKEKLIKKQADKPTDAELASMQNEMSMLEQHLSNRMREGEHTIAHDNKPINPIAKVFRTPHHGSAQILINLTICLFGIALLS